MAKTTYSREELERQLAESRREFWAADATINNLELRLAEMAAQLANAEKRIAELELREVVLPQCYSMLHRVDFDEPYHAEMVSRQHHVLEALHNAVINVTEACKGEAS